MVDRTNLEKAELGRLQNDGGGGLYGGSKMNEKHGSERGEPLSESRLSKKAGSRSSTSQKERTASALARAVATSQPG